MSVPRSYHSNLSVYSVVMVTVVFLMTALDVVNDLADTQRQHHQRRRQRKQMTDDVQVTSLTTIVSENGDDRNLQRGTIDTDKLTCGSLVIEDRLYELLADGDHYHDRRRTNIAHCNTVELLASLDSRCWTTRDGAQYETAEWFQRQMESLSYVDDVLREVFHSEKVVPGASLECDHLEHVVNELTAVISAADTSNGRTAPLFLSVHSPTFNETLPAWKLFDNGINQYGLYTDETDKYIDEMMSTWSAKMPPVAVDTMHNRATSLKMMLQFEDGSTGYLKVKRQERDYQVPLSVHYFNDVDRHNAEIAAFHLDRLLGFRRVPPVVGLRVKIMPEMFGLLDEEFQKTFFQSPAGSWCFHGLCACHCRVQYAACDHHGLIEGSLSYGIPAGDQAPWMRPQSPWMRTYKWINRVALAEWETGPIENNFCDAVRATSPWDDNRSMLSLIDLHIFDFLQGNMDRHHLDYYEIFGSENYFIAIDNGKGFGRAYHDEMSILAPLYQCCLVRLSTVKTLLNLQGSPSSSSSSVAGRLSDRMRQSLSKDPLSPVISDAHLEALDRRVGIVLDQIHQCLQRSDASRQVIFNY